MKFEKYQLITLAGFLWFVLGITLLTKGLYLMILTAHLSGEKAGPILNVFMYAFTGGIVPAALTILLLGVVLGIMKGRWALGRAATLLVRRIYPMRGKIHVAKLYRIHDYLLIVGIIALSRLLNWIEVPNDVHSLIDIAVGSALINGAMVYFRYAIQVKDQMPIQK